MTDRRLAVVAINENGSRVAAAVAGALGGTLYLTGGAVSAGSSADTARDHPGPPGELVARLFEEGQALVLVMAAGIAVRLLGGLPEDKRSDPPVVVLDTAGRYAVSLLSGHEGGANALAYRVAAVAGAEPVITTGSEVRRTVVVGLGCRRGVEGERILAAVDQALVMARRHRNHVRVAATADLKQHEPGIDQVCGVLGVGLRVFSREAIRTVDRLFGESPCARKYFDVGGVAEPCAFLAARQGRIILPRLVAGEVTVALAEDQLPWSGSAPATRPT